MSLSTGLAKTAMNTQLGLRGLKKKFDAGPPTTIPVRATFLGKRTGRVRNVSTFDAHVFLKIGLQFRPHLTTNALLNLSPCRFSKYVAQYAVPK